MKYIAMNRFKIILGKEKEFDETKSKTFLENIKKWWDKVGQNVSAGESLLAKK